MTRKRSVSAVIGTGALAGMLLIFTPNLQSQTPSDVTGSPLSSSPAYCGPAVAYEPPGNPTLAKEASASFDRINNNGLLSDAEFVADRATFDAVEVIADGLGPTYNAQSCRECHQNVVSGGDSQLTEVRSVRLVNGVYFESLGGSLIQARATNPDIAEHVGPSDTIRSPRQALQVLGDGFVECIPNSTLLALSKAQPSSMRGIPVMVPVLEADAATGQLTTTMRYGRFGWKSQHASLFSFASDAYLNEMGITNPLFPDENLSDGRYVGFGTIYDPVPDPEDNGTDVDAFTDFMRSTDAPSRGTITSNAARGSQLFAQIGCVTCHTASIITAPPGTLINAGMFKVPSALGNKIIHPYSDFLLHDIGTSDGIPIQPTPDYYYTANLMRTAPLWGLRTRSRLFHDSQPLSLTEAIQRHRNQATATRQAFNALSSSQKQSVLDFLLSL